MSIGTSKDKEGTQGNIGTERTDNKTARKHQAGRKQKSQAPEPVTADLIKITINHFFSSFNLWLEKLSDPRLPERTIYSVGHLFYMGLNMFLFHCGSRSQLESERKTPAFLSNLFSLSGTNEEFAATAETMSYFMELSNPAKAMESLPAEMTRRLIRSRVLDRYRNSSGGVQGSY